MLDPDAFGYADPGDYGTPAWRAAYPVWRTVESALTGFDPRLNVAALRAALFPRGDPGEVRVVPCGLNCGGDTVVGVLDPPPHECARCRAADAAACAEWLPTPTGGE